ncbi:MAG: DUF2752 domain-containing protein, partial [Bacteroidia bacterium]|nr:DUF2752 domain-containing protein [Bacteroidia bacterium]
SKLILETDCPGCGLTRGTQHLLHLDWQNALEYNPLVVLTTPLLVWLWFRNMLFIRRTLYEYCIKSGSLPVNL